MGHAIFSASDNEDYGVVLLMGYLCLSREIGRFRAELFDARLDLLHLRDFGRAL